MHKKSPQRGLLVAGISFFRRVLLLHYDSCRARLSLARDSHHVAAPFQTCKAKALGTRNRFIEGKHLMTDYVEHLNTHYRRARLNHRQQVIRITELEFILDNVHPCGSTARTACRRLYAAARCRRLDAAGACWWHHATAGHRRRHAATRCRRYARTACRRNNAA